MRRCQTDEGDGTAEGGNHCREKARDEEQHDAQAPDVETQIASILIAQQHGIQGFDEEQGGDEGDEGKRNEP